MRVSIFGLVILLLLYGAGLPLALVFSWVISQLFFGISHQKWYVFLFALLSGLIIDLITVVQLGITAGLFLLSIVLINFAIIRLRDQALFAISLITGLVYLVRQNLVGSAWSIWGVIMAMVLTFGFYWLRLKLSRPGGITVHRNLVK